MAGAFAFAMMALALIGAWRFHSPVPLSDAWHGAFQFYMQLDDAGWDLWWALHNEHRIFLSRLLFWVEYHWFGSHAFLPGFNILCVIGYCAIFRVILKKAAPPLQPWPLAAWLALCGILFSWMQQENFNWEFQSQFFLAQLLPFLGLTLLALFAMQRERIWLFVWACVAGFAAIGSMANGVLALPLMTLCAALLGLRWRHVLALASLSALAGALYAWGYTSQPGHGSVGDTLRAHMPGA